jgi:hypothetical protein
MSGFLVWGRGLMKDGVAKLGGLKGVKNSYQIDDGASRLDGWPTDATFKMSDRYKKDIGLADSMASSELHVGSQRLKDALTEAGAANIEYLPVQIINHKDRLASDTYFVINPLTVIDCVDGPASGATYSPINEEDIKGCKTLVLRADAIPPDALVFRMKFVAGGILMRRDLADKLVATGITGLRFTELDKYRGPS